MPTGPVVVKEVTRFLFVGLMGNQPGTCRVLTGHGMYFSVHSLWHRGIMMVRQSAYVCVDVADRQSAGQGVDRATCAVQVGHTQRHTGQALVAAGRWLCLQGTRTMDEQLV